MKYIIGITLLIAIQSCSTDSNPPLILNGEEILSKSIATHDPKGLWNGIAFTMHIQEPRLSNPSRYSIVKLNKLENSFELQRNRADHISKHVIDENGNSKVFLDDNEDIEESLVDEFRLLPERNEVYRKFYEMMYGLPMSLNKEWIKSIGKAEITRYNNQKCYKIPIELQKEMFSKHWIIYISREDYVFKGMDIYFPDDDSKGERLYFDGNITIKDINIPRIRHWHELTNDDYLGSDILVKEL